MIFVAIKRLDLSRGKLLRLRGCFQRRGYLRRNGTAVESGQSGDRRRGLRSQAQRSLVGSALLFRVGYNFGQP